MEKTDRTVALFGDCVTHMVGMPYRHTRAVGLTNWLSIVSPATEHFSRLDMGRLEPLALNNYEKRICLLNANKKFLEFLLEEKADFLILDCMDCRKGILMDSDSPDVQGKAACITSNAYMRDFGKTLEIMFGEDGQYRYLPATEIDRASYAEAAARICQEIRKVYEPEEIILLKHYYAVGYIDGKGMHKYVRDSLEENDKTLELVKYMESLVEENFPGCHVVDFPDNVFGDPKHRFGICSLHYHALYYEYARNALQLIFENHPDEALLLEQLRCNISMKFKILQMELLSNHKDRLIARRIDNVVRMMGGMGMRCPMEVVSGMLLAQDDIDAYLDALYMLRGNVAILLATKDSCGFYGKSGALDRLRRLGFREFPSKLWWMYAGMIVRGKPVLDRRAGSAEEPLEIRQKVGTHEVFLGARSFRNGNQAIIEVDGVNWCQNRRGINIVVFDPDSGAVLDSVSYDSHLMDCFARKSGLYA